MSAIDLLTGLFWMFVLFVGIAFPCLSLLTVVGTLVQSWRFKKHASPILIPLIGPLCLSGLVLYFGKPLWLIPVVWITDIGTVVFLWVFPRIIADWWSVSGFTRVLTLRGSQGIQSAVLTLHSNGRYVLKRSWQRAPGECGICGRGEPGTYRRTENGFELIAHHGLRRFLRTAANGTYLVEEAQADAAGNGDSSLKDWTLQECGQN